MFPLLLFSLSGISAVFPVIGVFPVNLGTALLVLSMPFLMKVIQKFKLMTNETQLISQITNDFMYFEQQYLTLYTSPAYKNAIVHLVSTP